jgi:hypothetical protein
MAGSLSDYAELKILEHSVGKTSWTMPSPVYLALFTATPSDSGGGTEVSGGSYARVSLASKFAAAASGAITSNADIDFGTASANWGTITQIGIFDASTAGNLLWWGDLTASKTVNSGDGFKILSGSLTLSLN